MKPITLTLLALIALSACSSPADPPMAQDAPLEATEDAAPPDEPALSDAALESTQDAPGGQPMDLPDASPGDALPDAPQWGDCTCSDQWDCLCLYRTGGTYETLIDGDGAVDGSCPYDPDVGAQWHTLDHHHTRCEGAVTKSEQVGDDGWHCEGTGHITLRLWCGVGPCDLWAPCL